MMLRQSHCLSTYPRCYWNKFNNLCLLYLLQPFIKIHTKINSLMSDQPRHFEARYCGHANLLRFLNQLNSRLREFIRNLVNPPMPNVGIKQNHSAMPQSDSGTEDITSPNSLTLPANSGGGTRRRTVFSASSSSSVKTNTSTRRLIKVSGKSITKCEDLTVSMERFNCIVI
jgi:hypothetical protein